MASLHILFNGVDDPQNPDLQLENPNIRFLSGQVLYGVALVITDDLPKDLLVQLTIKLTGKTREFGRRKETHTVYVSNGSHGGHTETRTTYVSDNRDVKFLKEHVELKLYPLPSSDFNQPANGRYKLFYAFSYQLSNNLEQSYSVHRGGGPFVSYSFKAKVNYPNGLMLKTKRPLNVMGKLPDPNTLSESNTKKDKQKYLTGGEIQATCYTDKTSYKAGELIFIVAEITNNSNKEVQNAILTLQEVKESHVVHRNYSGSGHDVQKADLTTEKVRGIELGPKSQKKLKMMFAIPPFLTPTTTHLLGFTQFHFNAKLRLEVPWGTDIRVRCPVILTPDLSLASQTYPLVLPSYAIPYLPPNYGWAPQQQGAYPQQAYPAQPGYPPQPTYPQPGYPTQPSYQPPPQPQPQITPEQQKMAEAGVLNPPTAGEKAKMMEAGAGASQPAYSQPPPYTPPPFPPVASNWQSGYTFFNVPTLPPPYVPPQGLYFTCEIVSASGLPKMDPFPFSSDPYVTVWLGDNVRCTTVKKNTLTPVWNEKFLFPCQQDGEFRFACYDWDNTSDDDYIGEVTLKLSELNLATETTHALPLVTKKGKHKGDLVIKLGPPITAQNFEAIEKQKKPKKTVE
eukprot:TRINITY_DN4755_c0_g2_i1.p1 TRINITY_DN4755_c0_g2~~TRINITY_DN4755_c0_g2_i1.p1  ORF type:complete len:638 (-),score=172.57 TRINITY_DN4755_c0_g2_i1:78-1943(-)